MYHVVEQAGRTDQHTVKTFEDWTAAYKYVEKSYDYDEMGSLRVDIMRENDDGSLTTEY